MFLSLDGTVWIQLINFVVFFAVLNVVFLRPVGDAIRKRRAYIEGVKNDTEWALSQARELRAQAEQQRAGARRAAAERFSEARTQAIAEGDRLAQEHASRASAIASEVRLSM